MAVCLLAEDNAKEAKKKANFRLSNVISFTLPVNYVSLPTDK